MNFRNATMRPGRVLEVYEGGKIKASVPGLFNKNDLDGLPILSQFMIGGSPNSFSTPQIHDEIWVINDDTNPDALYWFRKDKSDSKNFEESGLAQGENVEIVCNKETDTGWATIMFSNGTGWVIKNDEVAVIIGKDGDISFNTGFPYRAITINDNGISLGSETKSEHPAAFGDKTEEALDIVVEAFDLIMEFYQNNSLLAPLVKGLSPIIEKLSNKINSISSTNVYLD